MLTGDDDRVLAETQYRLLLPTIPRWTKIDMRRKQNVAEHSFNVLILALSLYDFMQTTPHNSFERVSLMEWAIDHDMDEIETADIPSDFKRAVEKLAPGAADRAAEEALSAKLPSYIIRKRGLKDSYPYDIVKIADKLEELLYNRKHGYDYRAAGALVDGLYLLRERLIKAERAHPRYDWGRAREWLRYFLEPALGRGDNVDGIPSQSQILGPA
jgi:5'-deoxynucleotidase YfbR-like HD superfamily hydrolase